VRSGPSARVALAAQGLFIRQEAREPLPDLLHLARPGLGRCDRTREPGISPQEADERERVLDEIAVDLPLDLERSRMLPRLLRRQVDQLRHLPRVVAARGLPRREILLLVPDDEAAQAGLEVNQQRLKTVGRRDHLLRLARLIRAMP